MIICLPTGATRKITEDVELVAALLSADGATSRAVLTTDGSATNNYPQLNTIASVEAGQNTLSDSGVTALFPYRQLGQKLVLRAGSTVTVSGGAATLFFA